VDDVVQDTLVRAFAHPETYDPARGRVDQWLWWLCRAVRAYNVRCASSERRGAGWERVPLLDDDGQEFRTVVGAGVDQPPQEVILLLRRVRSACRELLPKEAEALRLQVEDGGLFGPDRHRRRYHLRKARERLTRIVGDL
jgi:DNA-directed RNA polymerase specialized sigma24 family protein